MTVFFYLVCRSRLLKRKKKGFSPERKILIIISYYVISVVVTLTALVLATRDSTFFFTNLFKYFSCEAFGHDPEMPCDPNTFRQYTHTGILAAAHILVMLFPAINLLYVLNVKELREACHMIKKPSFCQ